LKMESDKEHFIVIYELSDRVHHIVLFSAFIPIFIFFQLPLSPSCSRQ